METQAEVNRAAAQEGLADMSAALDRALEARALEVGYFSSTWQRHAPLLYSAVLCIPGICILLRLIAVLRPPGRLS